MRMEYKVLTLWEPWATLVVHGIKKIETRPRPTSWTIEKGTYLIHAAKKWTREQDNLCTYHNAFRINLNEILDCIKIGRPYWKQYFDFGHIIGSVEIKECCIIHNDNEHLYNTPRIYSDYGNELYQVIKEPELSLGNYEDGRYAWILENQRVLKNPIPYKGGQGYYQNFKGDKNQLEFI